MTGDPGNCRAAPRPTGEPLDFAIAGDGFFGVRTARGVRYTRHGRFTMSPQGVLVTAAGDPVLGRGGRTLRVGLDGRVDPWALEVTRLESPRADGGTLVLGTPNGIAGTGQVRAGALEAEPRPRSLAHMVASLREVRPPAA